MHILYFIIIINTFRAIVILLTSLSWQRLHPSTIPHKECCLLYFSMCTVTSSFCCTLLFACKWWCSEWRTRWRATAPTCGTEMKRSVMTRAFCTWMWRVSCPSATHSPCTAMWCPSCWWSPSSPTHWSLWCCPSSTCALPRTPCLWWWPTETCCDKYLIIKIPVVIHGLFQYNFIRRIWGCNTKWITDIFQLLHIDRLFQQLLLYASVTIKTTCYMRTE